MIQKLDLMVLRTALAWFSSIRRKCVKKDESLAGKRIFRKDGATVTMQFKFRSEFESAGGPPEAYAK